MKVLRSIHTLDPAVGGPIESIKQSSVELTRLGNEVEIICLDPPEAPWLREFPLKVHALGPGRGSYGYSPAFSSWIAQKRAFYDAVIVHGIWQYTSFGVWRALHGTPTPYLVFPHGMLDPWFKRTYPLKHIKKLLYWPWAEYRVLRDAKAVLFTSEEERRLARQSFVPYRCREEVVSYGTASPNVDTAAARERFLETFPHLRGKRVFLFLGRLHEKKGCDLLIQAFAKQWMSNEAARSSHLVMAGPGEDKEYGMGIREMAEALFKERSDVMPITFTGMLSGDAKWGAFTAAEAFILPSHQENFGIAVVEALACATPVLISNKVNIWREIVDHGAGFAEDDNLAGTSRLLERWLAVPEAERGTMRRTARSCFEEHFEIKAATESLLSILRKAIASK